MRASVVTINQELGTRVSDSKMLGGKELRGIVALMVGAVRLAMTKVIEALVEFFGSLFGVRSVINRPLHSGTDDKKRR